MIRNVRMILCVASLRTLSRYMTQPQELTLSTSSRSNTQATNTSTFGKLRASAVMDIISGLAQAAEAAASAATEQSGTVLVNGRQVDWRVVGEWTGVVWRYNSYSNKSGNWCKEVSGLQSRTGAKEHGFRAIGAA